MALPVFPEFAPIELGMRSEIEAQLKKLSEGISEFTFANLYLFRNHYGYRISHIEAGTDGPDGPEKSGILIIAGESDEPCGRKFVSLPTGIPARGRLEEILSDFDRIKNLSEKQKESLGADLEAWGYEVHEDRDNFDYLYRRQDLAELPGAAFHKKKSFVNYFRKNYQAEERQLDSASTSDALALLDIWRQQKGYDGDYDAAREALQLWKELELQGRVYYVGGKPVGWWMGEPLGSSSMFTEHFEKGDDSFKGVYQYLNQSCALSLPAEFEMVNREQDLGDEGLRQAKMTYRPAGFVKKYCVHKK